MSRSTGGLTRTIAFFRKDLMEVLRQPRLILTLVIGPFLILLAFGLGYDSSRPTFDTILVVPPGSGLEGRGGELAESLGQGINLVEVTTDEAGARSKIADDEADLLVVIPPDSGELIRSNQQAPIQVYHSQIDPFQRTFIDLAATSAVEELNRAILREVVAGGQRESEPVEEALPIARTAVDSMSTANENGEPLSPADQLALERGLLGLGALASYRAGLGDAVGDTLGDEEGGWEALARALEGSRRLREPGATQAQNQETLAQLSDDLAVIEANLPALRDVDPRVLVSPFSATVGNARGIEVDFSHFYVPGVVALLLQHLAVTFAALSVVRERTLGSVELFRVSPLSAGEALTGKYLAYLVLGGLIATCLTVGAMYGFSFHVAGSWLWYGGVAFLVIMGSLGAGFVISAAVKTESEAIQYAMILLLISIFFSGFFIPLDRMNEVVRMISYLLPATYGIEALQQVAFLGVAPDPLLVAGAAAYALILLVVAWVLMRRRVVTSQKSTQPLAKTVPITQW